MIRERPQLREYSSKKKFEARSKSRIKKALCYEYHDQGHCRRDYPQLKRNKKLTMAIIVSMISSVDVNSPDDDDSSFGKVIYVSSRHEKKFLDP